MQIHWKEEKLGRGASPDKFIGASYKLSYKLSDKLSYKLSYKSSDILSYKLSYKLSDKLSDYLIQDIILQIILEAVFVNLHLLVENQLTDKRRRLRLAQILTLSYEFCAVLTKLSDKLSYKLSDKLSDKLSSQTNQKFTYKLSDIIIWILGGFNQAYLFILENSVKIWASSLLL